MPKIATLIGFIIAVLAASPGVYANSVHHTLDVTLEPESHRLIGTDHIDIQAPMSATITFDLAAQATKLQVSVNGQPARFSFARSRLSVDLPEALHLQRARVTISYRAVFQDPVPVMPVNTDNPGYGVTGTIQPQGTLLLAGSNWYPRIGASDISFDLRVVAPAGVVAVTAGRSLGHETRHRRTVSTWRIDQAIEDLALSAAPYRVRERRDGDIVVATYFLPANDDLSESYLTASIDYLKRYEALFGPYPFPKFAIVENFFPTGYGFPSYTLIGGRVLRLPFIVRTSLGHEIAHCWWGNGVLVDRTQGNWSEALTTYCADYLYREDQSPQEARSYRLQMLRDFATLVTGDTAIPLNQFQHRYSPATRAIGYGKGAMVFHMLRRLVGEDAFWGALRDIYRDFLFRPIAWQTFRTAFEQRSGLDLSVFFEQWLTRDGAPQFALQAIGVEQTDHHWVVTGVVRQTPPYYTVDCDLALRGAEGEVQTTRIKLVKRMTSFRMRLPSAPVELVLDPDVNIFRKLQEAEIPPSVNAIKGATNVAVVLAKGLHPAIERSAQTLLTGLGISAERIVKEQAATATLLKAHNLVLIGYCADIIPEIKSDIIGLNPNGFRIDGVVYEAPEDVFFGVFPHPLVPGRVAALYYPLSDAFAERVARKITHYGRYSYLAFDKGQNRAKGIWPLLDSPVVYRWPIFEIPSNYNVK